MMPTPSIAEKASFQATKKLYFIMRRPIVYLLFAFCFCFSNIQAQIGDTAVFKLLKIEFSSGGQMVKGRLFLPNNTTAAKLPAIVMAPGFSGTKECYYQFYAARFTRAGFAVLLFDYPNFGESTGAPRGEVNPWQQIEAYRDGISFLETRPEVDAKRIGVWGGSYSGGHALVVGALDSRVKCLVAMTPFISGSFYWNQLPPEARDGVSAMFNADRLTRQRGETPAMIPVGSSDPKAFCAIPGPTAMSFIQSLKTYAPKYINEVTLKSLEMQFAYEPGQYASLIPDGVPKLFIIARKDEMVPGEAILKAYKEAREPKKLEYLEGMHFSPYLEALPEASNLAIDWFKAHL